MKAKLTVLGSGTSMGVPTIGCDCAVCHSSDPRDRRTRPSVLIEYGGRRVIIDTTPDFREQAIRENIRSLDAVLYTHTHAGIPRSNRSRANRGGCRCTRIRMPQILYVKCSATFSTRSTNSEDCRKLR